MKSDIFEIKINNDTVVVSVDEPNCGKYHGEIILTPPFGITAKGMFSLSYFLTRNGFRVYRLDLRHHLGASTGEIEGARMSTQVEDILSVMKETNCSQVISLSLSCRATLRACRLYQKPVKAILITPVVDVRYTIEAASGEDLFDEIPRGIKNGATILGNYVKGDFIFDSLNIGFETWRDSVEDIASIQGQITFISGDEDPWVSYEHIQNVVAESHKRGVDINLIPVHAASHKINRNPAVATKYFEVATCECLRLMGVETDTVDVPNFKEIVQAVGEQRDSYSNKILSPWEHKKAKII